MMTGSVASLHTMWPEIQVEQPTRPEFLRFVMSGSCRVLVFIPNGTFVTADNRINRSHR